MKINATGLIRRVMLTSMTCSIMLSYTGQAHYSICAMFRNEGRFLREWIEFHRLVGFKHFYLYNDRSTDNFAEVLEPYIQKKVVTLINWPAKEGKLQPILNQVAAYNHCLGQLRTTDGWVAFIDIDEFLFPVQETNIRDVLKKFTAYGGLSVFAANFEYPNVHVMPHNSLVTKLFKKCTYDLQFFTKNLVQPKYITTVNIHDAQYKADFFAINTTMEKIVPCNAGDPGNNPHYVLDTLRINHYRYRDMKDLVDRLLLRMAMYFDPPEIWDRMSVLHQAYSRCTLPNKVDDIAIQKYVAKLEQLML